MYVYGQFVLMQSKNRNNIVKKKKFLNTSKNKQWSILLNSIM